MRRRGRELALQMLYQHELAGNNVETIVTSFEELQQAPAATREFAAVLVRGTIGRRDEIDARLAEQADNWRLDRMAAVDRNILRLAMYELLFAPDTPPAVVIDEAVEIAKRFGSERSSQFVNGVLDGFLHRGQPAR
ncbi:MAG: transcription antitermination factor NusB [Thermoanaerobaculaceae bacterium]|nr:transcription antitermination factor NusB [Thermoanaerobaculaceae bacterium]MDI9622770.1 transcription antitermination factor NusB [Acidobacteriota bacterium]HPW55347.1 transcription antitermination factor NusB [Thermoanaerobaculaceae bacterium]